MRERAGTTHELLRLRVEGVDEAWMRVAEDTRPVTTDKIKIDLSGLGPHARALSTYEGRASLAEHIELVADCSVAVSVDSADI